MPKTKQVRALVDSKPSPERYKNHEFMNPDGSIDGERLARLVSKAPGGMLLLMADQIIEEEDASLAQGLHGIIEKVLNLSLLTACGYQPGRIQLKAIEKLLSPEKFELPLSKIEEFFGHYETTASLARAWELRQLMSNLSAVVEPIKESQPYSITEPIKMRDLPTHDYFADLWDTAKHHLKTNSTLQSLAKRIYLERLQKQGVTSENETISNRTLKRDLENAGLWERTASEDQKMLRGRTLGASFREGQLVWYRYSEGWKTKRRARQRGTKTKAK